MPFAGEILVELFDGLSHRRRYFTFRSGLAGCGFVLGTEKQHAVELRVRAADFQDAERRVDVGGENGHDSKVRQRSCVSKLVL